MKPTGPVFIKHGMSTYDVAVRAYDDRGDYYRVIHRVVDKDTVAVTPHLTEELTVLVKAPWGSVASRLPAASEGRTTQVRIEPTFQGREGSDHTPPTARMATPQPKITWRDRLRSWWKQKR